MQAENLQLQRELFESKAALEAVSNEHGAALMAMEMRLNTLQEENEEKGNVIDELTEELASLTPLQTSVEPAPTSISPMNTPMKQQGVAMLGLHDDLDEVLATPIVTSQC